MNFLTDLWQWLEGKKTFFVGTAAVIVTLLYAFGHIDLNAYQVIMGLLGSTGLLTLKMGQNSATAKILDAMPDSPTPPNVG